MEDKVLKGFYWTKEFRQICEPNTHPLHRETRDGIIVKQDVQPHRHKNHYACNSSAKT